MCPQTSVEIIKDTMLDTEDIQVSFNSLARTAMENRIVLHIRLSRPRWNLCNYLYITNLD